MDAFSGASAGKRLRPGTREAKQRCSARSKAADRRPAGHFVARSAAPVSGAPRRPYLRRAESARGSCVAAAVLIGQIACGAGAVATVSTVPLDGGDGSNEHSREAEGFDVYFWMCIFIEMGKNRGI